MCKDVESHRINLSAACSGVRNGVVTSTIMHIVTRSFERTNS